MTLTTKESPSGKDTFVKCARFKAGQVVMFKREKKADIPAVVLEVIEDGGMFFYRVDRKNALSESMIRALTKEEIGEEA